VDWRYVITGLSLPQRLQMGRVVFLVRKKMVSSDFDGAA